MVLKIIQIILVIYGIVVVYVIADDRRKNRESGVPTKNKVIHFIIGIVVNFLDALGIGSYAPSVAVYGALDLVESKKIAGSLNIGVALPVILEALLFLGVVEVDSGTLVLVVVSGIIGAAVGNPIARRVSAKNVTLVMGIGLMIAAALMLGSKFGVLPAGGNANGLFGFKLITACVVNFILGICLNFGIGNFAPCMCVIYLLGMNPLVAFPIMMCTGAISTPTTGIISLKKGMVDRTAVLGMTVGGMIGVVVAVFIVKNMSMSALQWLMICIVLYSSITMARLLRFDVKFCPYVNENCYQGHFYPKIAFFSTALVSGNRSTPAVLLIIRSPGKAPSLQDSVRRKRYFLICTRLETATATHKITTNSNAYRY